ncbi:MAG: hypothetical protein ACLT6C_03645 [Faecalibacillus intestinalis]|uniref:hypothetical protein n=1 Tax=Faecalibacillus intestinalis TaxID=1982626 RepID=UPI00399353EA
MNAGGETADQAVRMTLQGIEMAANVALKAGGMASKSLAVTLYAILTDKKKVKGKTRAIDMIILGFGIVQLGLSLKSHDPSQRANGFLTVAGGIVITFAKEILNTITG